MKPIKLEFSGLNSYRSRQVIDFEKLGADGLFGIFGDTGSGKSSILDAITLALFGSVDRADNNTRGIINQLEKALEVSFEFELGGDRYRVERLYERRAKDPDSAEAKRARLRRSVSDGEEVLASRPQEVTATVQELLGISKEEFSRAVVLPQGKFDQFLLQIKPAERAAMLEHLFNLGQFGDELANKASRERAVCAEQIERIEGEEQGLGDCSEEAIAGALRDLQAKGTELDRIKLEYENADKAHRETIALRDLYLKKKDAETRKAELDQDRDAVAEMEARLAAAERAEPLRSMIDQQDELAGLIAALSGELQGKAKQHAEAAGRHQHCQETLAKAEKDNTELVPQLVERKGQLQQAKVKVEKIEELTRKAGVKQAELNDFKARIGAIGRETATWQGELEAIKGSLASVNEQRRRFAVDPAEREAIDAALDVLLPLEEQERKLTGAIKEHARRKDHTDTKWAETVEIVHELLPDRAVSPEEDIGQWAREQVQTADGDLKRLQEAHRRASVLDSAVAIARELRENEPCPVCGAKEHPRPAASPTAELAGLEAEIQEADRKRERSGNWENRLIKTWHDWSNNEPHTRRARDEMEKIQAELAAVQEQFERVRGQYGRESLRPRKKELAELGRQFQKLDRDQEAWQKRQEELRNKLSEREREAQEVRNKEAAINQEIIGLGNQIAELRQELNAITSGADPVHLNQENESRLDSVRRTLEDARKGEVEARGIAESLATAIASLSASLKTNEEILAGVRRRLEAGLKAAGFGTLEQAAAIVLTPPEKQGLRANVDEYRKAIAVIIDTIARLDGEIKGRPFDEADFAKSESRRQELFDAFEGVKDEVTLAKGKVEDLQGKQARWLELQQQKNTAVKRKGLAEDLLGLLRGRRFVSFLAQEHLRDMALEASHQLGRLTNQRYALELAKDRDCEFVIRDDYNGGNRRMVGSLSGGEVFLTSLALALALSSKIQLRGRYPLGFFFLDEGFGGLDEGRLDKVMDALEKLHDRDRMVGVISHVREMRERVPKYLEVVAAGEDGGGSEIKATGS